MRRLDQIIVGGESGPGARPFNVQWARDTIMQCRDAGVACFVKQVGAKPFDECARDWALDLRGVQNLRGVYSVSPEDAFFPRLKDRSGGDMSEWPEDLRVREFPT